MAEQVLLIDSYDQQLLRVMENKLRKDFVLFYRIFSQSTIMDKGVRSEPTNAKVFQVAEERITQLIKQIQFIESPLNTVTVADKMQLIKDLTTAGQELKMFQADLPDGNTLNELAAKGLNITSLIQSLVRFKGRAAEIGKPPTKWQRFQESHPSAASSLAFAGKPLKALGTGVLHALPLGGLAMKGAGMLKEHLMEQKAQKQMQADKLFAAAGSVSSVSASRRDSASGIEDELASAAGGYGAKEAGKGKRGRGDSFKGAGEEGMDLKTFFSTGWRQAIWTKKIYEALVDDKIPEKEPPVKKEGSGLGDILKFSLGTWLAQQFLPKFLGVLGNPLTWAVLATAVGTGMALWDAKKGQAKSEKEGWLTGVPEQKQSKGQNVASSVGAALGGTGPGLFDKGSAGAKAKNVVKGGAKGAIIGAGIGGLLTAGSALALLAPILLAAGPVGWLGLGGLIGMDVLAGMLAGAVVGGGSGAALSAVGGKKISQGIQGATRAVSLQNPQTGKSLLNPSTSPVQQSATDSAKVDKTTFTKTISPSTAPAQQAAVGPVTTTGPSTAPATRALKNPEGKDFYTKWSGESPAEFSARMSNRYNARKAGLDKAPTEDPNESVAKRATTAELAAKMHATESEYAKQVTLYHKTGKKSDLAKDRALEAQAKTARQEFSERVQGANLAGVSSPERAELDKVLSSPEYKKQEKEMLLAVKEAKQAQKTKPIPIDDSATEAAKKNEEHLSKLNETLTQIKEDSKAKPAATSANKSGYDANNIRDPRISAMNQGAMSHQ